MDVSELITEKRQVKRPRKFTFGKSNDVRATGEALGPPPQRIVSHREDQTPHSPQVSSLDEGQTHHDLLHPTHAPNPQRKVRLSTDIHTRVYSPSQPAITTPKVTTMTTTTAMPRTPSFPLQHTQATRNIPPGSVFRPMLSKHLGDNAPAPIKQGRAKFASTPTNGRLRQFKQVCVAGFRALTDSILTGTEWTNERKKEIMRPYAEDYFGDGGKKEKMCLLCSLVYLMISYSGLCCVRIILHKETSNVK